MHEFRILAHRGASVRAPENTLSAFRRALETGSREIETDVQLTRDGTIVLCHDDTLARYGHGERRVEECSYAELSTLDFGSWFSPAFASERIVRLEELLAAFGGAFFYHLELKGAHPRLPAATMELVKEHGLWSRCVFTSFSWPQLVRARAHSSEARLGWLVREIDDEVLSKAEALSLFQVCPKADSVDAGAVGRALKVVPEVRAWGCPRSEKEARSTVAKLRESGCCGLTVDEPLWVV